MFCRRGKGAFERYPCALLGGHQQIGDRDGGLSHAETGNEFEPSVRSRQTLQAQHLAEFQFYGTIIRL